MADATPTCRGQDPSVAALLAVRPALSMHAMDGLVLEDVPLNAIADALGTPTWVMSAGTLRARYRRLAAALAATGRPVSIHFAVKANDHLAVLRVLAAEGAGADVVSGGELRRAMMAGIPAARIVFSGVGKTLEEMRCALQAGIAQINVESAEELELLSAVAEAEGLEARVALRINPDVDAGTHAKITTGLATNKFGIPYDRAVELYARAATLPGIRPVGLAMHIGSQIVRMQPYRTAYARLADLVRAIRARGLTVEALDCGGGLGISYRDETEGAPEALAAAIHAELGDLGTRLAIEPGRWLAGPAGVLLSTVILRKTGYDGMPPFLVLDAAMNDLMRPSLYDAWHGIVPLSATTATAPTEQVHVVGPVCESGDTFGHDRTLPHMDAGARVALLDCGAYGMVMSSTYNARPLAAQVMVDGNRWSVIRERQQPEDLWASDRIPDWVEATLLPAGGGL
ncbi:diaminopimelate decarboxylase [Komagataeibacter intermedius]|uniref:Diaminopimelate decarboxylase n=2 Tax=Komagataeibacter intermedius TaxID=66229 RepID=A0A0N1FL89_9PROT|nr:diaminopimelate decarboxylase [Komagataeibacter intermedius]KPH87060.1 diaminopimelate decarboxylase [Komagataeibacter intermedius AF2]MCF3636639.1 diaminopimelate decarboxylase [Komagataeibacter intermedius]GAN88134.1 diaminopimelate decarboxylase [Komagataeibacter intermedius TF2]